ncbi:MAG: hypothetical protein JNJ49_17400 [Bdellovibrionaceae bacterium]|nr:hypothetical protein [Pseudobdellovibrionaceae bacterium]
MKIAIITSLALAFFTAASSHAQIAVPMPNSGPVAKTDVYICTLADGSSGGALAVSIAEEKLWLMEQTQNQEGLTLTLENIVQARCPHTYKFVVDMMGEKQDGELSGGCAGEQITLKISRTPTDSMDFNCIYKP